MVSHASTIRYSDSACRASCRFGSDQNNRDRNTATPYTVSLFGRLSAPRSDKGLLPFIETIFFLRSFWSEFFPGNAWVVDPTSDCVLVHMCQTQNKDGHKSEGQQTNVHHWDGAETITLGCAYIRSFITYLVYLSK